MRRVPGVAFLVCLVAGAAFAANGNDSFGPPKGPTVAVAATPPVTAVRGKPAKVRLDFRVGPGFHINSNQPNNEFMIPTLLKLDPPTNVMISKIEYSPGTDMKFPFLPGEMLNVYSGDFSVSALVTPSSSASLGTYRVHGMLKYQGCDNRQCYPPKSVPVDFDIKIQRPKSSSVQRNPAQSPHIHE